MAIKKNGRNTLLLGAVAASSLLLTACNDSDDGSTSSVTYTGITTAATIDSTAAPELVDSVLSAVSMDPTSMTGFVGVEVNGGGESLIESARRVVDIANRIPDADPALSLTGAKVSDGVTVKGCSGSASFSMAWDDSLVDVYGDAILYSMSGKYNNYVEDILGDGSECSTETINGSMVFKLSYDDSPELNGMTVTVNDYTVKEGGVTQVALDGSMGVSMDNATGESSFTMTFNAMDNDGTVFRVKGLAVKFDRADNVTGISGRLYDPARGYVDLSTTTQFGYTSGCYDPFDYTPVPDTGVLRIDGANGGYIEVDAAGDSCSTYTLTWSEDGTSTQSSIRSW